MVMAKVPEFLSPGSPSPQQDLGLDLHGLSITTRHCWILAWLEIPERTWNILP